MKNVSKRDLVVPLLLVALSAVPMLGGTARLMSLSAPASEENARFLAVPAPVVLHIFAAGLYCLLGAFQFSTVFRVQWPAWHRRVGTVLVVCGLAAALTGVWMAAFYAIPGALQGPLLEVVRLVVGASMATAIVLAWTSIRRRQVARHEAWMIRAYALGQGAGTQVLVMLPVILVSGELVGLRRDLLMSLSWAINVVVAEWVIRRRRAPRAGVPALGLGT